MKLQRDKKNIKKKRKEKKKKQGVNLRKINISKVIRTKREYNIFVKSFRQKKEKKKRIYVKCFK